MKKFELGNMGRTVAIELERGDKVIESIEKVLSEMNIKNAIVGSAVGSIQKLNYHRPTDLGPTSNKEFLCIEAPMEVGSLTGSVIDGRGHFHIVATDTENVYGGHLEPDTEVLYLLEIVMIEIANCNLERKYTPEEVWKLFVKGS